MYKLFSRTMTRPPASLANYCRPPFRVEIVLTTDSGRVRESEEIFEYYTRIVEVVGPSTPRAHITDRPSQAGREILASSSTEGVCAKRTGIRTFILDVEQIVPKSIEERIGRLRRRVSAGIQTTDQLTRG